MIRPSDLIPAATWTVATRTPTRIDSENAAAWFDGDATCGDTRIAGDLSLGSRGLSVEQHAARVLMHLRGDGPA